MTTGSVLPFYSPATGERFGQVMMATPEEACRAMDDLRSAATSWRRRSVAQRVKVLRQFQAALVDARDEISATITQDTGKPRQDSLIEVFVTVDVLNQACRHAEAWLRPERVPSGLYLFKRFYVEPMPYGVVAVIAPWNYPFMLAITPLVSALLAGNTVMLKPSEVTAATGVLMERLVKRVPAMRPLVRVVHGDRRLGEAVVQAAPDFIFLTGSTATGRKVMAAAAEHLIPTAMELGGKDPMIVLEDAQVAAAAEWGAWGAFYNAGQSCVSVERVYVVQSIFPEFVERAVAAAARLRMGYDLRTEGRHHTGPLASRQQLDLVEQHVADAVARGARVLCGGKRSGLYYEPTVLVKVDHDMLIMREETFGPVMPIMAVRDEAEAIQLANDSPYGLSASIWSADLERARAVARQLRTGSVIINDTMAHFGVPHLAFGGTKASGFGRTHGKAGLLQFTQPHGIAAGGPPHRWDVATFMRRPGHYQLGAVLMQVAFGVTPRQRLAPVAQAVNGAVHRLPRRQVRLGLGIAAALAGLALSLGRLLRVAATRQARR